MTSRSERIAAWLRDQAAAANARGFILGMSGGIDSAVVARLCQKAVPDGVLGVIMPCHSHPGDELDAIAAAEASGLPTVRVDLSSAYHAIVLDITAASAAAASSGFAADPARAKLALTGAQAALYQDALGSAGWVARAEPAWPDDSSADPAAI